MREQKMKSSSSSSHSPRRSQWSEFLQTSHHHHPHHYLPTHHALKSLTPTSGTSSLRRQKAMTLYEKRLIPYSTLERSLYGTIDEHGHYKSPSRILFESGYLTGENATNRPTPQHIYENLYNDPSSPKSAKRSGRGGSDCGDDNTDRVDGVGDTLTTTTTSTTKQYRHNLRDSVQLKASVCRDCASSKSASCPRHPPPPLPHHHYNTSTDHHHQRNLRHHLPHSTRHDLGNDHDIHDETDHVRDSPLSSSSSEFSSISATVTDKRRHQHHDKLHHVIQINNNVDQESSVKSKKGSKIVLEGPSPLRLKKQKKKSWREQLIEVDPLTRYQFLQSTLIIANVIAIFVGVVGLLIAGFVAPRPVRFNAIGGQLVIASIYIILTSLAGLYGARRESCTLLVLYGTMIVISLFLRSIFYFIVSFISTSSSIVWDISMIAAFLEVLLILFAFGFASEVRLKKLERKSVEKSRHDESSSPAMTNVTMSADIASSESSNSGSGGPPSTSYSDKEVLRV